MKQGISATRIVASAFGFVSLVAIGLFGQPNMLISVAVEVAAILVALLGIRWPSPSLPGA